MVAGLTFGLDARATIGAPTTDANGVLHYAVTSPNEGSVANDMQVVLPVGFPAAGPRRFLYVLPVEAGLGTAYGDPVAIVRALGLLDGFQMVLVVPSFTEIPWYGDNPTNPAIREETYMVDDIVGGVDALYPSTGAPAQRLLVGFSKSGMGVVSLLLRHPQLFAAAAAWDAPLDQPHLSTLGGMMHPSMIALLGLCLGELWDLEALSADCAIDKVYECMVTIKPLNLVGGVGSPASR